MTRIRVRAVRVGLTVSLVAAVLAYATSGGHALLLDVYLLCMAGVLLLALLRTVRVASSARSSSFDAALAAMRGRPADSGPPDLTRDLELARLHAFHLHSRVRPVLREIAAERLQARYGVDLDREPARARELVGAAAWDVVRPGRPAPTDRLAAGPSLTELKSIVEQLEAI